jgi:hypothetical protein
LISKAENSEVLTNLARARQVRNGLMVALLALCPIRPKDFAALEIGRSFVEIKGKWWIVLAASETKENRADERPVDELLTPGINCYLTPHRPVLGRENSSANALALQSGIQHERGQSPTDYSAIPKAMSGCRRRTDCPHLSPWSARALSSQKPTGPNSIKLSARNTTEADQSIADGHIQRSALTP